MQLGLELSFPRNVTKHGTHTAATSAGENLFKNNYLSRFNGIASKAKLAIYEFPYHPERGLMVCVIKGYLGYY